MIAIVGSPLEETSLGGVRAGGLAVVIARAAAAAGGEVEVVGKVGEDPAGEAVLLDLARAQIGHVALIRDPSQPTGRVGEVDDEELDAALIEEAPRPAQHAVRPPAMEPADLELALRYLPDYRVLVVADDLTAGALETVIAAARWTGAALVVVLAAGDRPGIPEEATVLERPEGDADLAFGGVVGAYAAALDRGEEPAEAFVAASAGAGWSAVAD
jgi:sugar/nucleoside kinase (ribokinase family)